jgi:uncharacterized protein (TIGR03067 family)
MRTFTLTLLVLALASFARSDDTDPEPPGATATLRKLNGTWNAVRQLTGVNERKVTASYTFEGSKVTYSTDKGQTTLQMVLKTNKKLPNVIELTPADPKLASNSSKYYFKIEKGELYLMRKISDGPRPNPDFSGKVGPVLVLTKEMK